MSCACTPLAAMPAAAIPVSRPAAQRWLERLSDAACTLRQRWRERIERGRTRADLDDLAALDARTLKDIGWPGTLARRPDVALRDERW